MAVVTVDLTVAWMVGLMVGTTVDLKADCWGEMMAVHWAAMKVAR